MYVNEIKLKMMHTSLVHDFKKRLMDYDIIFLYESWANENTVYNLDGYSCYNFYRKFQHRKARRRSGGVALFLRDSIKCGVDVIKNSSDTMIWLKINKSYYDMDTNIFLVGVYIWDEKSPAYNVMNVNLFDILQDDIFAFSQ